MATSDQKAIATAGIIAVGVGSANSLYRNHRVPSYRFLIGSGVAWLILSAMAEFDPDIAKGLAMGIMTTVVLGEGGGLFGYVTKNGEDKTHPPTTTSKTTGQAPEQQGRTVRMVIPNPRGNFRADVVTPIPGLTVTTK